MHKGEHFKNFLLFCWRTPFWLKVLSGGWWMCGLCDHCFSPSPKNKVFGFLRLGLNLVSGFGAFLDRGLGTWTRAIICISTPEGFLPSWNDSFHPGMIPSILE